MHNHVTREIRQDGSCPECARILEASRPPVTLAITLRHRGYEWVAESDDLEGFTTYDVTRELTEARARRELEPWLGDHVTLEFRAD